MSLNSFLVEKTSKEKKSGNKHLVKKYQELHDKSVSSPPKKILEANSTEKIETDGALAYWIHKEHQNNGILVYLHGGAFIFGPVDNQWAYVAMMSNSLKMAAVVINYGQVPDHPFPDGLNDCLKIIQFLQQEKSLQNGKWFILGDSAGGNLALSVTYQLRDSKLMLPAKLVLMSPSLDLSLTNPALKLTEKEDKMLSIEDLNKSHDVYADGEDFKNPLLSPMFGDYQQLPSILLQTATAELFLWDCRKFYLKCLEHQVDIYYQEYQRLYHDFFMSAELPESKKAISSQQAFIKGEKL